MSREIYCKFCGRELDEGKCSCNAFLLSQNKEKKSKKEKTYIACDTCKTKVENDSNFCTHCGLPIHANGKIEELQKELEGLNAPDVIEVYAIKDNKKKKKESYSLALIAMVALATFVFGIAIGLVIKPKIDSFIKNMAIKNSIALEENTTAVALDTTKMIEETTTINGPTVNEEILSPTEGTKKESKTESAVSENKNIKDESSLSKQENDESESEKTETAEGKETNENASDKKNLIDKTTKVEKTTITKESETENTIESTSITDLSIHGEIKGVSDEDKKNAELYIQGLRSIKDSITQNGESCEISLFAPVIAGKDDEEVKLANAAYTYAFDIDFLTRLKKDASSRTELPKSIVFTQVEQKNLTKNRLFIVTHGKITPKTGLPLKVRYRALYDRKDHTVKIEKIAE